MDHPSHSSIQVLGQRLLARRQEANLPLHVLSDRAGVSVASIDAFEQGRAALGAGALYRIARVLGIPISGLLSEEAPDVPAPVNPSVLLLSAGVANLTERDRDRISRTLVQARSFLTLGRMLGYSTEGLSSPSPAPSEGAHKDGYAAARHARRFLGRVHEPLADLSRTIEDSFGILVADFRFETPHVSAAAARCGESRVIIVDSHQFRTGGLRRALAHELGHHIRDLEADSIVVDMAFEGSYSHEKSPIEQRADAFAVMFIAPEEGMVEALGGPAGGCGPSEARELALKLRARFGLGYEGAVRQLQNHGYFDREIAETILPDRPADDLIGFEEHRFPEGLTRRVREADARDLLTAGLRRELLGTSIFDEAADQ